MWFVPQVRNSAGMIKTDAVSNMGRKESAKMTPIVLLVNRYKTRYQT